MKKIVYIFVLLFISFQISSMNINANKNIYQSKWQWQDDEYGRWLSFGDSTFPTSTWLKVEGKWYYFNKSGYVVKSTWIGDYYLGEDGVMYEDRKTPDGYYVNKNGKKVISGWKSNNVGKWYEDEYGNYPTSQWKYIDGYWYYFNNYGFMLEDTVTPDGYTVDKVGRWIKIPKWKRNSTGWWYDYGDYTYPSSKWEKINGKYYYFDDRGYMLSSRWVGNYYVGSDGAMYEDRRTPDGFYVDTTGKKVTGWRENNVGKWYEYDYGVYPVSQWKYIDGYWYYFNSSGYLVVDGKTPDGFLVDKEGKWITKIWKEDEKGLKYWMYYEPYPKNQWKKINSKWYWFNSEGYAVKNKWVGDYYLGDKYEMLVDTITPDGYYVDESGKKFNQHWEKKGEEWIYYKKNSKLAKSEWVFINSNWYYFDEESLMVKSKWVGDYYLGPDGDMYVNKWIGDRYVDETGKWVKGKIKDSSVTRFQYQNLLSKTNYSADELSKMVADTYKTSPLATAGEVFKKAEKEYNINALYLLSHAILESDWGRSRLAKEKNNFFGIAAYDNGLFSDSYKFKTVEDGILSGAKFIYNNYLKENARYGNGTFLGDLKSGMNKFYSTDNQWGYKIAEIMFIFNKKYGLKD